MDRKINLRVALLLVLFLTPPLAFGMKWVFSLMQSTYTLSCNLSLAQSLGARTQTAQALLAADFTSVKLHHKKLNGMSDDEFKHYLSGEIRDVALCHPMTSDLVGILPGKDYLAPLDALTSVPSSVDRKVSYTIWAYSTLYRSLNKHIGRLQLLSNAGVDEELAAAQRLADRLRNIDPAQVAKGAGGAQLGEWLRQEGFDSPTTVGALRPTIPVYALIDRELTMYEVETVHLLFPSSIISGQGCYERFAPDYPMYARLVNSGKAIKVVTTTLTIEESAEMMKFFNSAADTQAQAFLLSDLTAIAVNDASSAKTLTSCLNLTVSTVNDSLTEPARWEHGTVVNFEAEDNVWQALIAMLAAKRILVAAQD